MRLYWVYRAIRSMASGCLDRVFRRKRRRCIACNRDVIAFLPYRGGWRSAPPLLSALSVIGSDLDHFACPRCGANDRERHLLLYLRRSALLARPEELRILHFAPEPAVSRLIADLRPNQYVQADLLVVAPGIECIDLHSIPYPDASFDLVIANHVLEHVGDDRRVLAELHRVLTVGGHAILQTPYSSILSRTLEDSAVVLPEARLELFGQEDHVRLYGSDLFERLFAAGFVSCLKEHVEVLPDIDASIFGVNVSEPFMCFRVAR